MTEYWWVQKPNCNRRLLSVDYIKEVYTEKIEKSKLFRIVYVLHDGTIRYNIEEFDTEVEALEEIIREFIDD